ncbi:MFS general substrate transporter [Trichocladium antarcticum]|uniref:MFS general substrate transporter n=1 Tax=Trichocladium antarcticum TaxID=1450529 RepID=A0AAN6UHF7_9PEZI|nr:MFS general substrate transporter [Trichocladium antarcticum]
MSSAEEPLIRRSSSESPHPDDPDIDDDHAATKPPAPSTSPTLFIYLLTISAGISGLLFGYDTGVISATLISLNTSLTPLPLTALAKSVITSSTSLAALVVAPFSSVLADGLGRRRVILVADLLFLAGALVQALSRSVPQMVAGRAVVGMAVGAASAVVPLYIAELAPARFRGRLVTMNVVFITLGQVVAYVVGWVLGEYGDAATAWRWMVGLGGAPAVVQLAVMAGMPETPRWLVMVGRGVEARGVVERVLGGAGREVDATVKGIEREVREESEGRRLRSGGARGDGRGRVMDSVHELFGVRRNRRALAIACLLQGLQQLCGFVSAGLCASDGLRYGY